jgi:hypothetical protein
MRTLLSVTLLWCLADVSRGDVLGCLGRSEACEQHAFRRGGVCLSLYGVPSDDVLDARSRKGRTETSAEELRRQYESGRGMAVAPYKERP